MPNAEHYRAAYVAILYDDPITFIEIIKKMDDVNFAECFTLYRNGNSPATIHGIPLLHAAISLLNFDCINALLAKGAMLNMLDLFYRTAMDYIMDKRPIDATQISLFTRLNLAGAKLSDALKQESYWNGSNLHAIAARNDSAELAEALLRTQPHAVNWTNACGHTPLHTAVFFGYPKIIEVLLRHRADPTKPDNSGVTPLGLVRTLYGHPNHQAICHLLQDYLTPSIQPSAPASYAGYRGGFHQSHEPSATAELQDFAPNANGDISNNKLTEDSPCYT